MKYRDPKTGEVFCVKTAVKLFCTSNKCSDCRLHIAVPNGARCGEWAKAHPADAARLMGLEVVEDAKPARKKPISIERLKMLSKMPVYLHIYGQWEGYAILRYIDVKRKRFRFEGAPNLNFDDYMRTWEAFEKKEEPMEKKDKPRMMRAEILDTAKTCVCGQREQDYGSPEDNFAAISKLWNAYLGDDVTDAHDVAMMMALLKIARIRPGQSLRLEEAENGN